MKTILSQLKALELLKEDLQEQLKVKRANQKFTCGCGMQHKFKDCDALTTLEYESPHGCTGGDYWYDSEFRVVCPRLNILNSFLFKEVSDYRLRDNFEYNAKEQFKRIYLPLFKSHTRIEGKKEKRSWWDNYNIDQNHVKYGINIKGDDK